MKRYFMAFALLLPALVCAAQPRDDEYGLAAKWEAFRFGDAPSLAEVVAHRDMVAQTLGGDRRAELFNAGYAIRAAGKAGEQGVIANLDATAVGDLLSRVDMGDPAIVDAPYFHGIVENYCALEALSDGAPRDEAWGTMVFNTAVPTLGNRWDYYRYRRVLETGNDALILAYFPLLKGVFRYNGYTAGLEELRPLIEERMPDGALKDGIMEFYSRYAPTREGVAAREFTMAGLGGMEYSLSDFRGKVLVVDVWATWCSGCIAKLPAYIELRGKYAGRDDIEFITISIDDEDAYLLWKYSLPGYGLLGMANLFVSPGSSFKQDYNITGIPRYFVIDRNGLIVTLYAPAPGNEMKKIIDRTLNK